MSFPHRHSFRAQAAPPGGWPGAAMGFVLAQDASGYVVDSEDYLLEYSAIGSYPSGPYTNGNGASAEFGIVSGSTTTSFNQIAGVPRYQGMVAHPAGGITYRMSVPGGNYQIAAAITSWHGVSYNVDLDVRPDGASLGIGLFDAPNVGNAYRLDMLGVEHTTSAAWEAAEPTARVGFSAVNFVDFVMDAGASMVVLASIRLYEV